MKKLLLAASLLLASYCAVNAQGVPNGGGMGVPCAGGSMVPNCTSSAYDTDAQAIFNAFTTPPTDARKQLISSTVVCVKQQGVWVNLDLLYVMAAADSQAATINWKNPGLFILTPTNSPTFTADRGFTGNGTSSRQPTGWAALTNGVNYTQNSASLWVWTLTDAQSASADIGLQSGSGNVITTRNTSDLFTARVNDADVTTTAVTNSIGLFGASRVSASTKRYWKNGVQLGADVTATSVVPTSTGSWLGGANTSNFSAKQEAIGAWGASLSGLEAKFYNCMLPYMQIVGATP